MSEPWTDGWRELCLQALCEFEPERRMVVLERMRGVLCKETHKFGPLWADFANAEVKRDGNLILILSEIWSFGFCATSLREQPLVSREGAVALSLEL